MLFEEVARKYKELQQVEQVFRDTKSILETMPIYHQTMKPSGRNPNKKHQPIGV
jgi:hypothetical protein